MKLTKTTVVSELLNKESREKLIFLFEGEQAFAPELINRISQLAYEAEFTNDEIRSLYLLIKNNQLDESIFSDFIYNPSFPEELLYEMYEDEVCIMELAHRSGPIPLLLKIARNQGIGEAIVTVGTLYYKDDSISDETFKEFIVEFKSCRWLLDSLIRNTAVTNSKTKALIQVVENSEFREELLPLRQRLEVERLLRQTTDVTTIAEYFNTYDPHFLQAISVNPHTPRELLQLLSEITDIKFANAIRTNAALLLKQGTLG